MKKIKNVAKDYTEILNEYFGQVSRDSNSHTQGYVLDSLQDRIWTDTFYGMSPNPTKDQRVWPSLDLIPVRNPTPGRQYQNNKFNSLRLRGVFLGKAQVGELRLRPHPVLRAVEPATFKDNSITLIAYNIFLDILSTNFPKVRIVYEQHETAVQLDTTVHSLNFDSMCPF